MSKEQPIIEVRGISKDYEVKKQRLHVLEKVDLELYPDEILAIIGPSGCGKSTLLRIIAGLIPTSHGQIYYHGKKIKGVMPGMSMVFQSFALYPWMTVRENIEMVLKVAKISTGDMKKQTDEIIKLVGLEGFEEAYPRELSGGMKQRVGMARALVRKPEMLFMDEPFSELDTFTAEVLREEVVKIWADKSLGVRSILIVSHDVQEVAYLSDRIIILGGHPATIKGIIKNKLPRPRNYHSPEFLELVDKLHDTYGPMKHRKEKPKERLGPLLPATHDEILGMLRYLNYKRGSQDIFKIGAESHQHFEKVAVILETLELLDFVEIYQKKVSLTTSGKNYLSGNKETRRKIWREKLLTIPIFEKVIQLLKENPKQSMLREDLILFLKKELPHQDPNTQFTILNHWGHYAGLFTYHKKYKYLTLNP